MPTQLLIDWSSNGVIAAIRRFVAHAVIVAALAGLTDLVSQVNSYHLSDQTLVVTAGFALGASLIHNAIIWLQTKADQAPIAPAADELA